jgi:hypothetical protein
MARGQSSCAVCASILPVLLHAPLLPPLPLTHSSSPTGALPTAGSSMLQLLSVPACWPALLPIKCLLPRPAPHHIAPNPSYHLILLLHLKLVDATNLWQMQGRSFTGLGTRAPRRCRKHMPMLRTLPTLSRPSALASTPMPASEPSSTRQATPQARRASTARSPAPQMGPPRP